MRKDTPSIPGYVKEGIAMAGTERVFRVFISSTFADLVAERNALARYVFPRLRDLCAEHGTCFQAIDLRWGISAEAGLDQEAMRICLAELARCQALTPRPNFLLLLGDRYGWQPLPSEIPDAEFSAILQFARHQGAAATGEGTSDLLLRWFHRDQNAMPPVWVLEPRQAGTPWADPVVWEQQVERPLRDLLRRAVAGMGLPAHAMLKYTASATHQEIAAGCLASPRSGLTAFALMRGLTNVPTGPVVPPEARPFIDTEPSGAADLDARSRLDRLKADLRHALPSGNIQKWTATLATHGVSEQHIGVLPGSLAACRPLLAAGYVPRGMCEAAFRALALSIEEECREHYGQNPASEQTAHRSHGHRLAEFVVGRDGELAAIADYIRAPTGRPLAVVAPAGAGASAVLAAAARSAAGAADVVVRFVGATPASTAIRPLLMGLCAELDQLRPAVRRPIGPMFADLVHAFKERLQPGPAGEPLVVLLDGVDHLSPQENALQLGWLPAILPPGVALVISVHQTRGRLGQMATLTLPPWPTRVAALALHTWLQAERPPRRLTVEQETAVLSANCREGLPLHLRLLADQARHWRDDGGVPGGDPGGLPQTLPALLAARFKQLTGPGGHGPVLCRRALSLLVCARNGVTEDELIELLSRDPVVYEEFLSRSHHLPPDLHEALLRWPAVAGHPAPSIGAGDWGPRHWVESALSGGIPEARQLAFLLRRPDGPRLPVSTWARLRQDLDPWLQERGHAGVVLLAPASQTVADLLRTALLPTEDAARAVHLQLADFLAERAVRADLHTLEELPFALARTCETERLVTLFSDLRYLHDRVSLGDVDGLIDDFSLLDAPGTELTDGHAGFVQAHAERLRTFPRLFFTLLHHEGFRAGREQARALASSWPGEWFERSPVALPAAPSAPVAAERLERLAHVPFPPSAATTLAGARGMAFFLRRAGQVGLADCALGRLLPDTVAVPTRPVLRLHASPTGDRLACAHDDGTGSIIPLEFDAAGALLRQGTPTGFRFRLPEVEDPVLTFAGNTLWFQGKDGQLGSLGPGGSNNALAVPDRLAVGELSGLATFADGLVAATFRCGSNSAVLFLHRGAWGAPTWRRGVDVTAIVASGPDRAFVAFSDRSVEVFVRDTAASPAERTSPEQPVACLAARGDGVVWVHLGRTLAIWLPGAGGPTTLLGDDPSLKKPGGLARSASGALSVVTATSAQTVRWAEAPAADREILRVFPPGSGSAAIVRRLDDELEVVDLATNRSSRFQGEASPGRSTIPDRLTSFARDGQGDVLCARPTGWGMLAPAGGTHRPLGVPPRTASIAGRPEGGFLAADAQGRVFQLGSGEIWSQVGEPVPEVTGRSQVRAFPGVDVWAGLTWCETVMGRDLRFVVRFLGSTVSAGGARTSGHRVYDEAGIDPLVVAWDGARRRVVVSRSSMGTVTVGIGAPAEHVAGREANITLQLGQAPVVDACCTLDGRSLYLLDDVGVLYRAAIDTSGRLAPAARPVAAGAARITHLCASPDPDAVLLVEDARSVFTGRIHEVQP